MSLLIPIEEHDTTMHPYTPTHVIPPGAHIQEYLDTHGMTVDDLSARTGLPASFLHLLVKGEAVLVEDVAVQLERVFGRPAQLWLNLERHFREALRRQV